MHASDRRAETTGAVLFVSLQDTYSPPGGELVSNPFLEWGE